MAEAGGAPGDVVALAVVQEETTFAGSRTSALRLEPDVAIAVDVTFATDQPGVELGDDHQAHARLGTGDRARGYLAPPAESSSCSTRPASRTEIPFTVESLGRDTGTDADAIHAQPRGRADRPGLGAAALHALAGRDGPLDRHRCSGKADRGVRAAAGAGHVVRALSHERVLLLFDIDGTLVARRDRRPPRRASSRRCARSTGSTHAQARASSPGRAYRRRDRPRDPARRRDVGASGSTSAPRMSASSAAGRYAELCPGDLQQHGASGRPRAARSPAPRADGLTPGASDRQLRGGRAAEARRAPARALLRAPARARSAPTPRTARRCRRSRAAAPANSASHIPRDRTLVIGDTPRDIACARADGVRCVAVATGPYAIEQLKEADWAVQDATALADLLPMMLSD